MDLHLQPPRQEYIHGWGEECHDPRPIIASWDLMIPTNDGTLVPFTFDIVRGSSPIVIGLDVKRHADTLCLSSPKRMVLRRPTDTQSYEFNLYTSPFDERLHVNTINRSSVIRTSMLSGSHFTQPTAMAKRLHRFTHARPDDIRDLCHQANKLTPELSEEISKVFGACEICVSTGLPLTSRKVSLKHINRLFNTTVQVDYMYPEIRGTKYLCLHIICASTAYSEVIMMPNRQMQVCAEVLEVSWIYKHGAPTTLAGDDEFDRAPIRKFLKSMNVSFEPRPSRRHNKMGIIERKNGTIKRILAKLSKERSNSSDETLLQRAVFISNIFSGNSILSSFQQARGYSPSILGLPQHFVTSDIMDAHKEQVAIRALQRAINTRAPRTIPKSILTAGTSIWVYYDTSAQNEKPKWIPAVVSGAEEHRVECLRKDVNTRRSMHVAYEDIRLAPEGELTKAMMADTLEDTLIDDGNVPLEDIPQVSSLMTSAKIGSSSDTGGGVSKVIHDLSASDDQEMREKTVPFCTGNPVKDIGSLQLRREAPSHGQVLTSNRGEELTRLYNNIGTTQVTRSKLQCAPPWLVDEAFRKELEGNWCDAFVPVASNKLPRGANIITSHTVYKIKISEEGEKTLKARIVAHGDKDDLKDVIRKDSATAQFNVIRTLLSLASLRNLRLATADIKGAFMQSGPIKRDIYMRPPQEWKGERGVIWKLTKLVYGIAESGRQWSQTIETWMYNQCQLERVDTISQLFIRRDSNGKIGFILAKVVDDLLIASNIGNINGFSRALHKRFEVGKFRIDSNLVFNGCEIQQDEDGNIFMSMNSYMSKLQLMELSRERKKQVECDATPMELTEYRNRCGIILWLGNGVLPQASFVSSLMQQYVGKLKVGDIRRANEMIKEIRNLSPVICYRRPSQVVTNAEVCLFSDAAFNVTSSRDYGQTGLVAGLRMYQETHKIYIIC